MNGVGGGTANQKVKVKSGEAITVNLPNDMKLNKTLIDFGGKYQIDRANVTVPATSAFFTRATNYIGTSEILNDKPSCQIIDGSKVEISYELNQNMSYTQEKEQSYNVELQFMGVSETFTYVEKIVQPKRTRADDFELTFDGTTIANGDTVTCKVDAVGLSTLYPSLKYRLLTEDDSIDDLSTTIKDTSDGNLSSSDIDKTNTRVNSIINFTDFTVGATIEVEYTVNFTDNSKFSYTVKYVVSNDVVSPQLTFTSSSFGDILSNYNTGNKRYEFIGYSAETEYTLNTDGSAGPYVSYYHPNEFDLNRGEATDNGFKLFHNDDASRECGTVDVACNMSDGSIGCYTICIMQDWMYSKKILIESGGDFYDNGSTSNVTNSSVHTNTTTYIYYDAISGVRYVKPIKVSVEYGNTEEYTANDGTKQKYNTNYVNEDANGFSDFVVSANLKGIASETDQKATKEGYAYYDVTLTFFDGSTYSFTRRFNFDLVNYLTSLTNNDSGTWSESEDANADVLYTLPYKPSTNRHEIKICSANGSKLVNEDIAHVYMSQYSDGDNTGNLNWRLSKADLCNLGANNERRLSYNDDGDLLSHWNNIVSENNIHTAPEKDANDRYYYKIVVEFVDGSQKTFYARLDIILE